MSSPDDDVTFHVGDNDLAFLGLAAVLGARFQARRKGASVPLPGFPQSAGHAVQLLLVGAAAGESFALDDVPELSISVTGQRETIKKLVALARDLPDRWPGKQAPDSA